MRLETELATTFDACNTLYSFEKFLEILSPELIEKGFEKAGVATVRKHRLPLKTVLWSIVGMS